MTPLLIERDAELRGLVAALDRARQGDGLLVAVEGPAGIGKTHLLRAAQQAAEERGVLVLSARGGELEQEFSNGVVRQLVERWLATADPDRQAAVLSGPAGAAAAELGLAPEATSSGAVGDRSYALLHGLYWLVANLAAEQPLMLAVDDVQWADAPSLRFLHYLARRLEGLPVLVVVTARPGEEAADAHLLRQILGDPAAQLLVPPPLSAGGTETLLRALLGEALGDGFAAACHSATTGNPFLLRQLADAVRADGVDPAQASADRVAALGARAVARSILARLAGQSRAATLLAQALAVLGIEARLRVAAAVAGLDTVEAAAAADELRAIDVLDSVPNLAFVHPVVRAAIYADIAQADRLAMHGAAARVLLADGAQPHDVAPHLLSSAPAADPVVVETLRAAARAAVRDGAATIAVRFLERALDEPPGDEARGDVLAQMGEAQVLAGDMAAAAATLESSVRLATGPDVRARRRLALARALAASAGPAPAIAVLDAAVADVGDTDRELTLRLEAELAAIGVHHHCRPEGLDRRLDGYRRLRGETTGECLLLATIARHVTLHGATAHDAAQLAGPALRDRLLLSAETAESIPLHHAIFVLILCDEADAARAALDSAMAEARGRGAAFGIGAVAATSAFAAFRVGDLMTAESDARNAAAAMGEHASFWPTRVAVVVQSLLEAGRLEEAEEELRANDALGAVPDVLTGSRLLMARARLALRQERLDAARADVEELGAREARWQIRDPESGWRPLAAELHRRAGEDEQARRLAAEQLERARGWGTETAIGTALRTVGRVGPADEASLAALEEAVERLARSPSRLELAHAHIDLGAALNRRGRHAEAREPLREGVALARACGALGLAEDGHGELLAAGARPRRLELTGVEALTAAERRVTDLAASGLGNREIAQELFVTVKTVENHLARAYQKLEIRSRRELPDALGGSVPDALSA